MRKLLLFLLLLPFVLILIAGGLAFTLGPGFVKERIEQAVNETPGRKLQMQSLRFQAMPQPTVVLEAVTFEDAELGMSARIARITAGIGWDLSRVSIRVSQPELQMKARDKNPGARAGDEPKTGSGEMSSKIASVTSRPIALLFEISKGKVNWSDATAGNSAEVTELDFGVSFDRFQGPWQISLSGKNQIAVGSDSWSLPVKLSTVLPEPPLERLKLSDAKVTLAGIPMTIRGEVDYATSKGSFQIGSRIEDISRLAEVHPPLAKHQLKGALNSDIHLQSVDGKVWTTTGKIEALKVRAVPEVSFPGGQLKGPVALDAQVEFVQKRQDTTKEQGTTGTKSTTEEQGAASWSFPKAEIVADLTQAELRYESHFRKAAGTVLKMDLDSRMENDALAVKRLRLQLDQVIVDGFGQVGLRPGAKSEISVQIPRTSLQGLEKTFPALASQPMKGVVELKGQLRGDLSKPEQLEVSVRPLKLSGMEGAVDWKSADQTSSARGPVSLDATVDLDLAGSDVRTADVNAKANLSGLQIHQKDAAGKSQFQKGAGAPLLLSVTGKKRGQRIEVSAVDLKLLTSQVSMKGWVSQPQKPNFDLAIQVPRYSYQDLSLLVPLLAEWKLRGNGSGQFTVKGTYDFAQGIEKSPVQMKGSMKTQIEALHLPSEKPKSAEKKTAAVPAAGKSPAPTPTEPLLPPWPVMRTLDVMADVKIVQVVQGDLDLRNVTWTGGIRQGALFGNARVENLFGGVAAIEGLRMSLQELQPDVRLTAGFQRVQVNQAVTWISPEWKDLVKGEGSGKIQLLIPHASRADFMERVQATGNMTLARAFFSGRPLEEVLNDALAKIPGVGEKAKLRPSGVASDLLAAFRFRGSRLELEPFQMKLMNRSELLLKGSLGMDMSMDLKGTGYLADPPIGGMVLRANSDPQGRFIIPLEIRGKMTEPSVTFAAATIEQLVSRTAKHEFAAKKQEAVETAKEKTKEKGAELIKKGLGGFLKRE